MDYKVIANLNLRGNDLLDVRAVDGTNSEEKSNFSPLIIKNKGSIEQYINDNSSLEIYNVEYGTNPEKKNPLISIKTETTGEGKNKNKENNLSVNVNTTEIISPTINIKDAETANSTISLNKTSTSITSPLIKLNDESDSNRLEINKKESFSITSNNLSINATSGSGKLSIENNAENGYTVDTNHINLNKDLTIGNCKIYWDDTEKNLIFEEV